MSDDSGLGVHYESLDNAARAIKEAANALDRDLDNLMAKISQVAATWEGEAQHAFLDTHKVWKAKTDHMQHVLSKVAESVSNANGSYRASDVKASKGFTAGY
ncbi:WXG100 family type VII secretion target [Streptomyces sp. H27-D2]|uniref:WXG100 family type VII secretion target n=1 Tax=Streptomyces sp. H27-D2 TaxID=3046304 RepID=UPI002DBA8D61|nr:WXG100 family type VII secretion target [Streptomyces sp. H27-D2]MEC4019174.1 WXG100 family type VII secretion target [Streptomyces sp. H27-D2]